MKEKLDENAIKPEETAEVSPENTGDEMEKTAETEAANPNSELEELKAENEKLMVFQNKVRDLAETDPQTAAFLHDLITTGSIGVALTENFSEEEIQALLEEAKSTEYDEHRNNYASKVGQHGVRMAELEANKAKSQMSAQEFVDKYQPNEEELEAFVAFYDSIIKDAVDNNMSFDHWEKMWQAFKYKGDVAALENKVGEAEENGKIAGRNENIVMGKQNREALADLPPEIGDGGVKPVEPKKKSFAEEFMNGVI